jgi:hypothetical protein
VCRSRDGVYQGALVVVFYDITDPGCLEALTCREVLALAVDLDVDEVMVATKGAIGSLHHFLGSLYPGAGGLRSHQTGQNQRWHFVWWPGSQSESQKVHVDWMLVVSIAVRAEHNAYCFLVV